jgi:hypothetical protein
MVASHGMQEMVAAFTVAVTISPDDYDRKLRICGFSTDGYRHGAAMQAVKDVSLCIVWQFACLPDAGNQEDLVRLEFQLLHGQLKSIQDAETYLDLTDEEYKETRDAAAGFTREMLLWHCSLLDDAYISMQRNIVSKRLCAEFTLIRMTQKPDDSPAAIAARVAAIEDAISSGSFTRSAAPAKLSSENAKETSADEERSKSVSPSKTAAEPLQVKKIFRAAGYWIEIIKKFEKADITNGSFLTNSQAYKNDKDGLLVIRLPNKFAATMLDKPAVKDRLITLAAAYDSINDIIFETEDKSNNKSAIDEIETDF